MVLRSLLEVTAKVGNQGGEGGLQTTYKATYFNRLALYPLRKLLIFNALRATQYNRVFFGK
ncbi:hypothetical protein BK673_26510 [Pseudomonas fluorescens]|jgi:hypothetical protein|uniref:Uncharacterized protein n=1 Tax=Pseudomonas fluorescens TaxID=294 RepID=A0A423NWE7_PSEFL|nr:hypothetical protein BOW65_15180 [Pseudomonas koreensis]ROO02630.1 hypothetical protein BK673_26510 [Pseudomonas fluorescens]